MVKVVVLGAGVVGVATAWHLLQAGFEVTVVDRQAGAGLETSFANGGQVSASHAEPWAHPGVIPKILRWLGREDAPLIVRWRADPAMIGWGLRFLANCTASAARINTERTLRIALYSRACLKNLQAELPLHYDQLSKGILHVYRDAREFRHAAAIAAEMTRLGCRREAVSVPDCVRIEPALAPVQDQLAGGIFSPDDESGDAHRFTRELAALAASRGAAFRFDTQIQGFDLEGQRIRAVRSDSGPIEGDAFVLALGCDSPIVARSLGLFLPVYPAKGYSVTLPVEKPEATPSVSLTDDERKLVFSRLGDRMRIAGTAELTGYDRSINEVRAKAVLKGALDLFPQAFDPAKAEFWAGLRPVTPDSVPLIGQTRYANLFLNTGHGTLGWTMSCGSGRVVADLIAGRTPEMPLDGFGLERFRANR